MTLTQVMPYDGGSSSMVDDISESPSDVAREPRPYWIHSAQADLFFGGWICLNAVALAVETDFRTDKNTDHVSWFVVDSTFNVVFLVELLMRMHAERLRWPCDPWNLFDFLLVSVGIFDCWIMPALAPDSDVSFITLMRLFRLLRLLRILRVLRLFRFLKELMLLVHGIVAAMKAMVWGLLLLSITIFICSLLVTRLVGKACCDDDDTFQAPMYKELMGNLPRTGFLLFQFTMEFQPDVCRDTWDDGVWLTIFFMLYSVFTNITLLNIVASVIVESILSIASKDDEERKEKKQQDELMAASARAETLFTALDTNSNGTLEWTELKPGKSMRPELETLFGVFGVSASQAQELFLILDAAGDGIVSRKEFLQGLMRVKLPLYSLDLISIERRLAILQQEVQRKTKEGESKHDAILRILSRIEQRQAALESQLSRSTQTSTNSQPMPPSSRHRLHQPEDEDAYRDLLARVK